MTELTIVPNAAQKTMALSGVVAAGEPVAVTVSGYEGTSVADLRLRVLCAGKVVGVFPMQSGDAWAADSSGTAWTSGDAYCELNLNTDLARAWCKAPENDCLFILEDTGATDPDTRRLWAVGEYWLKGWPMDGTDAEPYALSQVPSLLATWTGYMDNFGVAATQTADGVTVTVTDKHGAVINYYLMNGADGAQGNQGPQGETGPQGPQGPAGSDATVTVDSALSSSSENPVQNKVVKAALDGKAGTSAVASAVSGEATARANADTALGGRIDIEASARLVAYNALSAALTAETTRAQNAESGIRTNVTANANGVAANAAAISALQTAVNNLAGSVPSLSGSYSLDTLDDLYAALTAVIRALGGTVA